jgi:hypothetical protein
MTGEVEREPLRTEQLALPGREVRHADEQESARTQKSADAGEVGAGGGNVLERVAHDDRVERIRRQRRRLEGRDLRFQASHPGHGARMRGRIDAGHVPAAANECRAEIAAAAADIEHRSRGDTCQRREGNACERAIDDQPSPAFLSSTE